MLHFRPPMSMYIYNWALGLLHSRCDGGYLHCMALVVFPSFVLFLYRYPPLALNGSHRGVDLNATVL